MLAAVMLAVAAVIVLILAPIVPLAAPAVPLAVLALVLLGIQYVVFRMAGLRSAADRERPESEDDDEAGDDADDPSWRG